MSEYSPQNAMPGANRWRRFADWDDRPLRLDKYAVETPTAVLPPSTTARMIPSRVW